MKHKIFPSVLAGVAGLVAVSGVGIAAAAGDRPSAPPEAVARPFDPAMAALGVDTEAKRVAIMDDQRSLAAQVAPLNRSERAIQKDGSQKPVEDPAAEPVDSAALGASLAVSDWNTAMDELYQRVANDPGSVAIRNRWLGCMSGLGYKVNDRAEVVEQLNRPEATPEEIERIGGDIDTCDAKDQASLDRVVRKVFPGWQKDNAGVIQRYKHALETAGS